VKDEGELSLAGLSQMRVCWIWLLVAIVVSIGAIVIITIISVTSDLLIALGDLFPFKVRCLLPPQASLQTRNFFVLRIFMFSVFIGNSASFVMSSSEWFGVAFKTI
jgi:hypothetical protein